MESNLYNSQNLKIDEKEFFMNNTQLERTLRLLRRTGDKAVVVDPGSDEVFMLMNLDAYESLLDEIDCADQMPSEVTDELSDIVADDFTLDETIPAESPELPDESEEVSAISEAKPVIRRPASPAVAVGSAGLDFSSDWPKKPTSTMEKEESLADVPDEGEEEKFYLEPVE